MERKPLRRLKLGDPLDGTILRSNGGRRFLVRCNAAPPGWTVELHTRAPEMYEEGANAAMWVAKISPLQREIMTYDGDHGRLPISEAMHGRYLEGLRALLGEVEPTGENLAEARSMVARIGSRQQADWLTVWRMLGEPGTGDQKALVQAIDAIRTARKEAPETMEEKRSALVERFGSVLRQAVVRLEEIGG